VQELVASEAFAKELVVELGFDEPVGDVAAGQVVQVVACAQLSYASVVDVTTCAGGTLREAV